MALNVSERPSWSQATATIDSLNEHTIELRVWLAQLEDWVETQLVATQALVAMLDEDGAPDVSTESSSLDALSPR